MAVLRSAFLVGIIMSLTMLAHPAVATGLLNPSAIGPEAGLNNSDLLANATNAWFKPSNNVTSIVTGGDCTSALGCLWVPWMGTSSSCLITDLKSGVSCNIGTVDFTHNCMVTDEFSQVGILLAGGQNQTKFDQFYNTVNIINSSNGQIPAWRIKRNVSELEACASGVNGNCDTASDATARIIIALYTASNNTYFPNQTSKQLYNDLAKNLSRDMVTYEIVNSCKNSTLGNGNICYWLKAGKQASLTSTDGSYTGYHADAELAMLQTCAQTGNRTFCAIAGNISMAYLQAAKYNGINFTVPPGRSYKWDNFSSASVPYANCTYNCNSAAIDGDESWEDADAPRAFFEGLAEYVDKYVMGTAVLRNHTSYMSQWVNAKMTNLNSVVTQYYPNGNNSASSQSGFVAQGFEAAGIISQNNASSLNTTVYNCMNHYTASTGTWDGNACPGIYNQAFCLRMLMVGMGRDTASFTMQGNSSNGTNSSSNTSITWAQNLTNQSQNWNTTFFLDANASNSNDCTVDAHLSNNSHFPINRTTGIITWSTNITKVGVYSLAISVNDSCTHNISQNITVNITYHAISITNVTISPASSNGSDSLTCSVIVNNTDGGTNTTTINWFKNTTLQTALQNKTLVLAPGNFTYGDVWICSARINDTITTTTFSNSTSLTITNNNTSPPDNGGSSGGGGGGGGAVTQTPAPVANQTNTTTMAPATQEPSLLEDMKVPLLFFGVFIIVFFIGGVLLAT
jgi:hypothetical protein